jgi:Fibronectin type III domain
LGFDAITITLNHTSAPDAPLALRVINITQTAVTLRWIPGFDGGIGQSFRIRYKNVKDDASFTYRDVFPVDVTAMSVTNLMPDSEYTFAIMAWNELGQSQFTSDIVKAKTLKGEYQVFQLTWLKHFIHICFSLTPEIPVTETEKIISKVISENAWDIPRLIIIVSLVGSSLLLFNIVSEIIIHYPFLSILNEIYKVMLELYRWLAKRINEWMNEWVNGRKKKPISRTKQAELR